MSLAINTTIPEGIVLATDSRQSFCNLKNLDVKEVAEKLYSLFDKKSNYREQLKILPEKIKNDLIHRLCRMQLIFAFL